VALLVALIPTTIGALLSASGIAGMDGLVQRNVLACPGGPVEPRATSTRCCWDKTARSPSGTGRPSEFLPVGGRERCGAPPDGAAVQPGRLHPEGRSIVVLAKKLYGLREREEGELQGAEFVEFTAQTG